MASKSIITDILVTLSTNLQPASPCQQSQILSPIHRDREKPGASPLSRLSAPDSQHAKTLLLTLHALFPHELLPALDILDRGLVTRLVYREGCSGLEPENSHGAIPGGLDRGSDRRSPLTFVPPRPDSQLTLKEDADANTAVEFFLVQSSSNALSAGNHHVHRPAVTTTFYEVRLETWNCSCAAFAVSSFQGLVVGAGGDDPYDGVGYGEWATAHAATTMRVDEEEGQRRFDEPGQGCYAFGGAAQRACGYRVPACKHIIAALLGLAIPRLFGQGVRTREVGKEEMVGWGGGYGIFR